MIRGKREGEEGEVVIDERVETLCEFAGPLGHQITKKYNIRLIFRIVTCFHFQQRNREGERDGLLLFELSLLPAFLLVVGSPGRQLLALPY